MDDRELLAAIGEALHRNHWKSELARDLGIDDRSLRRWVQTNTVPHGVWRELAELLEARRAGIDTLLERLRERS